MCEICHMSHVLDMDFGLFEFIFTHKPPLIHGLVSLCSTNIILHLCTLEQ
jgi:hypothetical protein